VSDRPGRLFSSVRALVRRALPRRTLPFWSVTLLAVSLAAGASPAFVRTAAAVTPPPGRAPSAAPEVSGSRSVPASVPVARSLDTTTAPAVAPLRHRYEADVIVVAQRSLSARSWAAVRRLPGVAAATSLDAARIQVNGTYVAMIGVSPSSFRSFAARPTASSDRLWRNVAAGSVAVSYDMGKQDHLPLGGEVHVAGRASKDLLVGGFATVGIGGIDAVVSHATATSLGIPAANAILISAPKADPAAVVRQVKRVVPRRTTVKALVYRITLIRGYGGVTASGIAGGPSSGSALSRAQLVTVINAAMSRRGLPYVWGAAGPASFDCSGLVQWSFARAGIAVPRVAADQARTGPLISFSQARPGDLLFWRTDPTAPNYISHVAIYVGNDLMIQAPQPGQKVEIVPVEFGAGFAGVVRVHAQAAASVTG